MGIEEQGNELTISSFLSILFVVLPLSINAGTKPSIKIYGHGFVIGDEAQELGESGVCNEAILSPTTCVYHSNSKEREYEVLKILDTFLCSWPQG
ncbi:hypothetical protein QL285_088439 [Trifolium repens]|nr:hypothetical protein QL285_088439 [Trifolium repens]